MPNFHFSVPARVWTFCIILCLVGFSPDLTGQAHRVGQSDKKPNIILIVADDLGYGDLGCYNSKSRIPTPNLDRMAAEGMMFTNAHAAASVCTPSRYAILTGRYPWRSRLKMGVLWAYDWPLIEGNRQTIAHFLKSDSYNTAIIGKWHLGWSWPLKDGALIDTTRFYGASFDQMQERENSIDFTKPLKGGPLSAGFDYQFGIDIPSLPPFTFIDNGIIVGSEDTALSRVNKGYTQKGWKSEDMMRFTLEKSVDYIRKKAGEKNPFFLFIPLNAPHSPMAPNQAYRGKAAAGDYGDFVAEIDGFVTKILKVVEEQGIDSNTMIIFTSDNGGISAAGDMKTRGSKWASFGSLIPLFGHDSNEGLRGMKGDVWEGGSRIPLIVRWPQSVKPDGHSAELVSLTDFFATFSALLHKALPKGAGEDSYSFLNILRGDKMPVTRTSLVAQSSLGKLSLIKGNWKYINTNNSGNNLKDAFKKGIDSVQTPGQLYNLSNDPKEQDNLYTENPVKVRELSGRLKKIVAGKADEVKE